MTLTAELVRLQAAVASRETGCAAGETAQQIAGREKRAAILAALAGGRTLSARQIREAARLSPGVVQWLLRQLRREGRVVVLDEGCKQGRKYREAV
jgi:DNA-binding transcriptional ArsR family regulator